MQAIFGHTHIKTPTALVDEGDTRRRSLTRLLIVGALLLAACTTPKDETPPDPTQASCEVNEVPAIGETARALAACLPPGALQQDAVQLLRQWERADDSHWGGAVAANLLPGDEAELVVSFHADMSEVIWNPQGKLAVLQAVADGWQVAFESPDPTDEESDGRTTLAGNWAFHVVAVGDVTGDGLDDLLVKQEWSNGHYAYTSHTKLFTADQAESGSLRVVYLQDSTMTNPSYTISDQSVQSLVSIYSQPAITYTWQLFGDAFGLVEQNINPGAAVRSATTADGANWYVYDVSHSPYISEQFGLYRVKDGELAHYDVPTFIMSLKVLSDDALYVGGTGAIFRVDESEPVNVLADEYAPLDARPVAWQTLDMALTDAGDLWAAGTLGLLHFGREQSTMYELIATRVLVAPDGSAWVQGWDGSTPQDCCYYHVQDDTVTPYEFDALLPVSAELEQQIRALRP